MILFFLFLLFVHNISGSVFRFTEANFIGFSFVGLFNLLMVGLLLINLPSILKQLNRFSHSYLLCSMLMVLSYFIVFCDNSNLFQFSRFFSSTLGACSVFYLTQYYLQEKKITNWIANFFKVFFIYGSIIGLWYAFQVDFDYNESRLGVKNFNFYLFEFPHSFGLFTASIAPIFIYLIRVRIVQSAYYPLVFFTMPIALIYSGARISILLYILTVGTTVLYSFWKKIYTRIIACILIGMAIVLFTYSPVYESIEEVVSTPYSRYQANTYNLNSVHTRIRVWRYMVKIVEYKNKVPWGLGWGSWDKTYWDRSGFPSAQSDYFVKYFDIGLIGLLGYVLFKLSIILSLFKSFQAGSNLSMYLIIGISGSLYLGGITETADGYASTAWLIPIMLGLFPILSKEIEEMGFNK